VILTGDIGGTKTLLALHDERGTIVERREFPSRQSPSFESLLAHFIGMTKARATTACFGVAGPVLGDRVQVTHLPWEVDGPALAARFGLTRVWLLNDFAAAAHGIAALGPADQVTLQTGRPMADRPQVVIGAGTGLGLAFVLGDAVFSGEAGHAAFAPADAQQVALWQWLNIRHGRVQVEHVVSGRGLIAIDSFLRGDAPVANEAQPEHAASIARAALIDGDEQSLVAVDLFLSCFGALAGDQALAVLARGGVYLAGGIAPRLLPRLAAGGFLAAFNDKGSYADLTRACPVHVVTNPDLPLLGAARVARRDGP